jgi:hypothetical protein
MAGPDTSRSIASHRHRVASWTWSDIGMEFGGYHSISFNSESKIHVCMYIRYVMAVLAKVPNKWNSPTPFKSSFCVLTGEQIDSWQHRQWTARIAWHWGTFVQPLWQWKSNRYYIFWVCVCVCVCVALGIQHAMRMRHIVICGLPGCAIYFNNIS